MSTNSLYEKNLILEDLHPDIKAYYYRNWVFNDLNCHAHDRVEIMYVISGSCIIPVRQDILNLKKYDFVIIDANIPHGLIVEKGSPCRILNIEFSFKKPTCPSPTIKDLYNNNTYLSEMINKNRPYYLLKDDEEIFQSLKGLINELNKNKNDNELLIQLILAEILLKISKLSCLEHQCKSALIPHVKKTLDYINNNYDQNVTAKKIAAFINLNEGYLQRIFKMQTGKTIVEYLTFFRIERAKMLLINTNMPIIDITNYIGFDSRQYFSFVFKKHVGVSPFEFRKSTVVVK